MGYTYVYQPESSFKYDGSLTPKDVNEKAVTLSEASVQKIMVALYELLHNDYFVEENASSLTEFVRVTDKQYGSSGHAYAVDEWFKLQSMDTQGKVVDVVIQRHDAPLADIETIIAHDLQNTDSKVASMLTEEARLAIAVDLLSRVMVVGSGGRFVRVMQELDTTESRRKGKK